MAKIKTIISILLLLALFPATAITAEKKELEPEEYIIKLEDELFISVWKHPDLDKRVKVDAEGNIALPLIGTIKAADLTIRELTSKITFLLEKDYIVDPLVTINIEKYVERQVFFIYGEVRHPGAHTLEGKMTLLRAITIAGGLSDFASSVVYIKRKVKDKEQRIKVNINHIIRQRIEDVVLKADDIIVVPRRFF